MGYMTQVKCPKCRKLFPTYAKYTKHYASAHYTKKAKKNSKKIVTGKIPVWAKKKR